MSHTMHGKTLRQQRGEAIMLRAYIDRSARHTTTINAMEHAARAAGSLPELRAAIASLHGNHCRAMAEIDARETAERERAISANYPDEEPD
jgi:hypothetical protein